MKPEWPKMDENSPKWDENAPKWDENAPKCDSKSFSRGRTHTRLFL